MNNHIIEELSVQANEYKKDTSKKWKLKALNSAINKIKQFSFKIESSNQLKNIKGFGSGICSRIDKILNEGSLNIKKTNNDIEILCSITGVGIKRAKEWISMNINTIESVKKAIKENKIKPTHHIKIGLKYYDDILLRIPRNEIQLMEKVLNNILHKINPKCLLTVCGSYRRNCPDSGDIDVIITHPEILQNIHKYKILTTYVKKLKELNFIVDDLTKLGEKKYMGLCKLPSIKHCRRIDIRCFNYSEYYAALLYFTGSKNLNVKMRKASLKKGYSLNEYGLKNKETKELIILNSEEECFQLLDMTYIKPENRNI